MILNKEKKELLKNQSEIKILRDKIQSFKSENIDTTSLERIERRISLRLKEIDKLIKEASTIFDPDEDHTNNPAWQFKAINTRWNIIDKLVTEFVNKVQEYSIRNPNLATVKDNVASGTVRQVSEEVTSGTLQKVTIKEKKKVEEVPKSDRELKEESKRGKENLTAIELKIGEKRFNDVSEVNTFIINSKKSKRNWEEIYDFLKKNPKVSQAKLKGSELSLYQQAVRIALTSKNEKALGELLKLKNIRLDIPESGKDVFILLMSFEQNFDQIIEKMREDRIRDLFTDPRPDKVEVDKFKDFKPEDWKQLIVQMNQIKASSEKILQTDLGGATLIQKLMLAASVYLRSDQVDKYFPGVLPPPPPDDDLANEAEAQPPALPTVPKKSPSRPATANVKPASAHAPASAQLRTSVGKTDSRNLALNEGGRSFSGGTPTPQKRSSDPLPKNQEGFRLEEKEKRERERMIKIINVFVDPNSVSPSQMGTLKSIVNWNELPLTTGECRKILENLIKTHSQEKQLFSLEKEETKEGEKITAFQRIFLTVLTSLKESSDPSEDKNNVEKRRLLKFIKENFSELKKNLNPEGVYYKNVLLNIMKRYGNLKGTVEKEKTVKNETTPKKSAPLLPQQNVPGENVQEALESRKRELAERLSAPDVNEANERDRSSTESNREQEQEQKQEEIDPAVLPPPPPSPKDTPQKRESKEINPAKSTVTSKISIQEQEPEKQEEMPLSERLSIEIEKLSKNLENQSNAFKKFGKQMPPKYLTVQMALLSKCRDKIKAISDKEKSRTGSWTSRDISAVEALQGDINKTKLQFESSFEKLRNESKKFLENVDRINKMQDALNVQVEGYQRLKKRMPQGYLQAQNTCISGCEETLRKIVEKEHEIVNRKKNKPTEDDSKTIKDFQGQIDTAAKQFKTTFEDLYKEFPEYFEAVIKKMQETLKDPKFIKQMTPEFLNTLSAHVSNCEGILLRIVKIENDIAKREIRDPTEQELNIKALQGEFISTVKLFDKGIRDLDLQKILNVREQQHQGFAKKFGGERPVIEELWEAAELDPLSSEPEAMTSALDRSKAQAKGTLKKNARPGGEGERPNDRTPDDTSRRRSSLHE